MDADVCSVSQLFLLVSLASLEFPCDYTAQWLANDLAEIVCEHVEPIRFDPVLINLCADYGMHSKFQPVLTQLSLSQVFSGLPCAFVVSMQPEMCEKLILAFLRFSYLQDLPEVCGLFAAQPEPGQHQRGRTVGVLDPFPIGSATLSQQSCRFLPKYHCKYRMPSPAQHLLVNTANPEELKLMFLPTELWVGKGCGNHDGCTPRQKGYRLLLVTLLSMVIFFNIIFS